MSTVGITSLSRTAADNVFNTMLAAIADSRVRDASVNIPGFGAFSTKRRSARQGRHPRTGETITIAASQVRSFKVTKALRDAFEQRSPRPTDSR